MQRAVEDGTVSPLLYEERVPELTINDEAVNRWFDKITAGLSAAQSADLKKKFANKRAVYGAANRIELIAWDIASHFDENFKKLGLGLKGQVATASKLDAIRYKNYLDDTGLVRSAIIISPPDTREGNTEVDESTVPEVQKWWNANVGHRQDGVRTRRAGGLRQRRRARPADRRRSPAHRFRRAAQHGALHRQALEGAQPHPGDRPGQSPARVQAHGVLVDYRGILKELDTAVRAYQDLEARTQGGYDVEDVEGLYRQFSTEYKRLPGLHQALWDIFAEVKNRQDLEQFRHVLMPLYAEDDEGRSHDVRQKVREDFYEALTQFGLCLQTALSSRSFFEDHSFSEAQVDTYKEHLAFFADLRQTARRDAMETVDYAAYEEQIRRMVDRQVVGLKVRDPEGIYEVHKLGQAEDPTSWAEEKTRNETDLIRTRLKKTIEQDLADDPYAQQVFADLLKQAIAQAEAMFDHPLKQYALFKKFEEQVEERAIEGMPDRFGDNAHARAYFGICRLVLGEPDYATADSSRLVSEAFGIDEVVRKAVAEHSLNPQNIEATIRQALLPRLFAVMGLDRAKHAIERVIQVTRIGLGRGTL